MPELRVAEQGGLTMDYPYFSLRDLRKMERALAVSDAAFGRYCKRTQKKRRKDARRNRRK